MKRSALIWIPLAALGLLAGACSDQNASVTEVHPPGWILAHGSDVGATGSADDCKVCHGTALEGGSAGVACLACHMDGPPFATHTTAWVADAVIAHLTFAEEFSWTTCATGACHGADLTGGHGSGETGPSCFTSDELGCHSDGPRPPASHREVAFDEPELHGAVTKGTPSAGDPETASGHVYCRNCHGRPQSDFEGGFVADPAILGEDSACGTCHPGARAHPTNWQGANDTGPFVSTHRSVLAAEEFWIANCGLCHATEGLGRGSVAGAPSCFSANFANALSGGVAAVCHVNGPGQAPHPRDGSYLSGSAHGPEAKEDLTLCQQCHGQVGGPGSNPRFNVGIERAGGKGCESCHEQNSAHPVDWAGPNDTYHYSAGALQSACTLCHGTALDGAAAVGVSCLECHSSTQTFALDCSACHGYPPDGTADLSAPEPVDHTEVPSAPHGECAVCHGVRQGTTAGTLSAVAKYLLFDPQTDTIGDHWNGSINMNGPAPDTGAGYDEADFGCDSAGCHGNEPDFRLSDSQLPVAYGDYGAGGEVAPHPVDGTYLDGSNHGPEAKADLTDCQGCHGQQGGAGTNPRFNLGIFQAGGDGCESCHGVDYAHPADWAGPNGTFHYTADNIENACVLCHGVNLDGAGGAVGDSCLGCHSSSQTFALDCTHCHGYPPDGAPDLTGATPVNHTGVPLSSHRECSFCHGVSDGDPVGTFGPAGDYALFNPSAETNGDHWDGNIQMNGETGYNQANFGCDTAGCHGNEPDRRLSDSQLPVVTGNYGEGVPHIVGRDWLLPTQHAQQAIDDDNGVADALDCLAASCHTMDVDGNEGSTACRDCHVSSAPVFNLATCTSCHGTPPSDNSTAPVARPNRSGAHRGEEHSPFTGNCDNCHLGHGSGSLGHYDRPEDAGVLPSYPAEVIFRAIWGANWNPGNGGSCSATNNQCHEGDNKGPWYE